MLRCIMFGARISIRLQVYLCTADEDDKRNVGRSVLYIVLLKS